MYYIQTIIIYLTLFFIMLNNSRKALKKNQWNNIIIALIFYTVIFGFRYNVGMEYPAYLAGYKNQGLSIYSYGEIYEPGFSFIIKFLNSIHAHFSIFFGLIAFIQIYYVFKAFKCNFKLYPYLIYTFMFGCVWLDFNNGLRQILALCFFIYSIALLDKKHWFRSCLIYTLVGMSMHKSAIILIILCVLLKYKDEWFNNLKFQFIAFLTAYIIGNIGFVQQFIGQFDLILSYMQYDHYLERDDLEHMIEKEVSRGIGFYGILCTDILLVVYSNKIKKYLLDNLYFKRIYNLFFIGILIRYAFLTSMMIQRVNVYFYYFKFIVAAYALYYAKKNNKYLFIALIFLYLLFFVGILSSMEINRSMYMFFWQAD